MGFNVYAVDYNTAEKRQIRPETAAGLRKLQQRLGLPLSSKAVEICYSAREAGTGNRPLSRAKIYTIYATQALLDLPPQSPRVMAEKLTSKTPHYYEATYRQSGDQKNE